MKTNKITNVIILSIMHLLVDGLCGYTIFNRLYVSDSLIEMAIVFVLYNSLAFMLQPFVGLLIDKYKKEKMYLNISLIALLVVAITPIYKWITVLVLGLSNAFFHVIGGKYTVYASRTKQTLLGLFVSLGATGLAIGSYVGNVLVLEIFVIMLIVLMIVFNLLSKNTEEEESYSPISKDKFIIVIWLGVAVAIRAIIGKVTIPEFQLTTKILVLIGVASSIGKILGGILADLIGIKKTVFITLPLAFIGYLLFRDNLVIFLISTILFNTTMPITLYLANVNCKSREGLSFGILAFTLFPGYLIGMLYDYLELSYIPLLTVSITLTIILIYKALYKTKEAIQ